jgi:hypothetical protein
MSVSQALVQPTTTSQFWLGFAAYVVPSFPIGYFWHLTIFAPVYEELAIYRDDIIVPFGLLAMLIQGAAFSFVYPRVFSDRRPILRNGFLYGLGVGLLAWSFMTLSVAAKNVMTSVPTYLLVETGFTLVQYAVAGPLIALAYRK